MRRLIQSKIFWAMAALFVVFLTGVFGFRFLSDYTWIDAAYMTIITITTVGFREVQPLSPFEKIFTSFLILSSILL